MGGECQLGTGTEFYHADFPPLFNLVTWCHPADDPSGHRAGDLYHFHRISAFNQDNISFIYQGSSGIHGLDKLARHMLNTLHCAFQGTAVDMDT